MSELALTPKTPIREVTLDLASVEKGENEENFVILAPEKKGRLACVRFKEGAVVRRTNTVVNQMNPRESFELCNPETGKPKYTEFAPGFIP